MSGERLARAVAAGIGAVSRLVFAASVVVGGYGAYLAWFVSLGQAGPGHDRLAGTIWMGIALGASLVACGLVLGVPALRRSARPERYGAVYAVFIAVFVSVLLPLSGALRCIGTWERTNTQVTSRATGCFASEDGDGGEAYQCDLAWAVGGRTYTMERYTKGVYSDGTPVLLWVDPVTGGPDDHDWVMVMWCFIFAGVGTVVTGGVVAVCAEPLGLSPSAWRRARVGRKGKGETAQTVPAGSEIRDAVVGESVVEDARPGEAG